MTISKAELIAQIVHNSGLTGQKFEDLKTQLQEKSIDELSSMISNAKVQDVGFKSFIDFSSDKNENIGNLWERGFSKNTVDNFDFKLNKTEPQAPSLPQYVNGKKLNPLEEKQIIEFAQSYLFNAAQKANELQKQYRSDIGIVDTIWHGGKNLVNIATDENEILSANWIYKKATGKSSQIDVTTLSEFERNLEKEYKSAQKIKNASNKGAFEFTFERERGVEFNPVKIQDFGKKSEAYLNAVAHQDKHESLLNGINEIKAILAQEQEYKNALKYVKGAAASSLTPPKVSSTQKFGEVFMQYCNGNKELFNQFKNDFFKDLDTPEKINKEMPKLLNALAAKSKVLYEKQLHGKSFEQHQIDYEKAFAETFGGKNHQEMTKSWIEGQKQGAGFVKMGLVVATTVMLGGSNLMAQGGAKLAQSVGTQAAGHIVKFGMTSSGVAAGVGIDYANALTSKSGLTKEKNEEILAGAKHMLPYAFFGSYVSGPFGEKVISALKGSTTVMPKILNQAFTKASTTAGFGAEVGLDTLFEFAISDGDLLEAIKGNATGEVNARAMNKLMTMIAGGRAHGAAKQIMKHAGLEEYKAIEQTNPETGTKTYRLVSPDGKVYKAESPEALIAGLMTKAIDTADKIETPKTPASVEAAGTPDMPNVKKVNTEAMELEIENKFQQLKQEYNLNDEAMITLKENMPDPRYFDESFEVIKHLLPDEVDTKNNFATMLSSNHSDSKINFEMLTMKNYELYTQECERLKLDPGDENDCLLALSDAGSVETLLKFLASRKEIQTRIQELNDRDVDISDFSGTATNEDGIKFAYQKLELAERLLSDPSFPKDQISSVLRNTNDENINAKIEIYEKAKDHPDLLNILFNTNDKNITLANKLCDDPNFPKKLIGLILNSSTEANITLANKLCDDPNFPKELIGNILYNTNENNINAKMEIYEKAKDYPNFSNILSNTNEKNITLAHKLCDDPNFTTAQICNILHHTHEKNITLANKLCDNPDFPKEQISHILNSTNEKNIALANKLCDDPNFPKAQICDILSNTNEKNIALANKLCDDPNFTKWQIGKILYNTNEKNIALANKLCDDPNFPKEEISDILRNTNEKNITLANKLCDDPNFPKEQIGKILYNTNEKNINAKIEIYEKIKVNPDFPKDEIFAILSNTNENNINAKIEIYEKIKVNPDFPKERIGDILRNTNEKNITLANKLCDDNNFPKDLIKDILNSTNEKNIALANKLCDNPDFPKEQISHILNSTNEKNIALANKLCDDNNFPKDLIEDILNSTNEKNIALANKLCDDPNFPKERINNVLSNTNENNITLAHKLCYHPSFPKENIHNILAKTNRENTSFIEELVDRADFPNNKLSEVARFTHNKTNLEQAKEVLDPPELKKWAATNLENNLSMEDIVVLFRTQKKLNNEKSKASQKTTTQDTPNAQKPLNTTQEAKPAEIMQAEQALVDVGVHPKAAPSYVKLCETNGIVDKLKLDAVCALAKVNITSVGDIKSALAIAVGDQFSMHPGDFRVDIIKDIVVMKDSGIADAKLAINLAAVKNMPINEIKARLNQKTRTDITERINTLSNETKQILKSRGTDTDAILEKLSIEQKGGTVVQPKVQQIVLRSLDSIDGVEKVILNKYKNEISQEIWGDPKRFELWANEKLEKVLDFEQNPNYTATGDYAKFNEARKEGIASWHKYLKEESNYKEDVFTHLLVMDGITKEMRPNNAVTPPAVSHGSFEATYNALLANDTNVSFSKTYAEQTKARAIKEFGETPVTIDGIEGQWVTIPSSQKGTPNYDEHVAMVQSLSEGSSWCLRFENAHSYLQGGNLHFFMDKQGNAQTAINETNGRITQIQKRYDQNSTVPIPYANVIDTWRVQKGFNGHEYQIETALNAKPEFDALKSKLLGLEAQGNSVAMFAELGISHSVASDGTYILSSYKPKIKQEYTLFDLGINENKLLQNVSQISSSINLDGSGLTAMPQLRTIIGGITLGDNKLSDVRNLQQINGKKIYWDVE